MIIFKIKINFLLYFLRISGNTARTKDIHGTVATHLKKSLAKKKWRKAYNAAAAIRQLQMLRLTSTKISAQNSSTVPEENLANDCC